MHGGISGSCKYFRMKLHTYHLSYGISFYSFRYAVGCPSRDFESRCQFPDSLMMECIDLQHFLSCNFCQLAFLYDGYRMGGGSAGFFLAMVDT